MLRPHTYLFAAATDAPEAGGSPVDTATAIAAIEDKTLPMSQRLGVALSALKGIAPAEQFTQVKADLATAQASLLTAQTDLATANKQITALTADVKSLEEVNAKLEQVNKDLSAKETDVAKRAKAIANEKVASLGFTASELPAADARLKPFATADEALAEYAKITDPKASAAFYAEHIIPRMPKN